MRNTKMLIATVAVLSACGADPSLIDPAAQVFEQGIRDGYSIALEPSQFVAIIDNPWLPLTPGSAWTYESRTEGDVERTEIVVTSDTRSIQGILATVVRDTVTLNGEVIEDTVDWFAQDLAGNVWYLGEDTTEYEGGVAVSKAGSWEYGVDGALAGIIMPADPASGLSYRQEYYPGEAEDVAEVVTINQTAQVPFGSMESLVVIREWTPLSPGTVEEKYYARGVGEVLTVVVEGGEGRDELVSYHPGT